MYTRMVSSGGVMIITDPECDSYVPPSKKELIKKKKKRT